MTDQEFDQPGETGAAEQDTPPIPTAGVPTAGAAIPLPPVGAPIPVQLPESAPNATYETPSGASPTTDPTSIPPAGLPYGSYALGALAGNPQLGSPSESGYGGPPHIPGYSSWAPVPPPDTPRPAGNHKRLAALIGAAAVIALAAGVGLGHVAWTTNSNSVPPSSSAGNGSGSTNPPLGARV